MPYKDKKKQKEAQRRYYLKNKEKYAENVRRRRKEYQEWILEIKKKLHCEECNENHPAVIDFHHLDGDEKEKAISNMVSELLPKKKILAEIDKCIVLCANCHRKLHWDIIKS